MLRSTLSLPFLAGSVLTLAALFQSASSIHAAEPDAAPAFELPKWETGEKVKLAGFAGEVVVLNYIYQL